MAIVGLLRYDCILLWPSKVPQDLLQGIQLNLQPLSLEHFGSQTAEGVRNSTFLWNKLPKCLNPHVNSYRTGRPSVFKRSLTLFTYKPPLVISDSLAPVKASAQFIHACSHVSYLSFHLHYLLLFNRVTLNCFFVSLLCLLSCFAFAMESNEICRLVL